MKKRPRVLIADQRQFDHLDELRTALPEAELIIGETRAMTLERIPDADIVFGLIDRELLQAATSLQWVHIDSAGVDSLPLSKLAARKIVLTNSQGLHADTIGDHVLAMILAFSRELPKYLRQQQARCWERNAQARELAGQTLGILGVGGIGTAVALRAKAFGMTVIGVRRSAQPHPDLDTQYQLENLFDMLARCDFLAICCPLTEATRGLINADALEQLPRGAFLVNIARGAIVDESALVQALANGHLGGAGLDVFESEPLSADSSLWDFPNVIITPHIAGRQSRGPEKAARRFRENMARWKRGEPLKWQVDLSLGY